MYEKIISEDPAHYMAYNNLGYDYFLNGQYENAIKLYKKSTEIKAGFHRNPNTQ